MKTALVATNRVELIEESIYYLHDHNDDWYIIVDEPTYLNLETEKRPHIVRAHAYTSLDLEPGHPLELLHWKFLEAVRGTPSELSLIIDLLYIEFDFARDSVPIGQILLSAATGRHMVGKPIVITSPIELKKFIDRLQSSQDPP